MNKLLIAPDSFKDCLTSNQVANHIKTGFLNVDPGLEIHSVPLADGGEGTVKSLVDATRGKIYSTTVHDPLMRKIEAHYGILGDGKTAVIEMAAASGLELLKKEERDPSLTTTYGTGELIKTVLDKGVEKIIIGVGGSATNDAGVGMAEALGMNFLNKQGKKVQKGGINLSAIDRIEPTGLHPGLKKVTIVVACDVDNPLTGPQGASRVYAPQKGADEKKVDQLDRNLEHVASVVKRVFGKSINDLPGAGAAGGLGWGLAAFLSADLRPGMEIIIEVTGLEKDVAWADLVITGEGKTDAQTRSGKTPFGVAQLAKKHNKPLVSFAGWLDKDSDPLYQKGFDLLWPIAVKPTSLQESLDQAGALLEKAAERLMRSLLLGKRLG